MVYRSKGSMSKCICIFVDKLGMIFSMNIAPIIYKSLKRGRGQRTTIHQDFHSMLLIDDLFCLGSFDVTWKNSHTTHA